MRNDVLIWFGGAIGIVVIAAALLLWIIFEARAIVREGVRARAAGLLVESRTNILKAIPAVNGELRGTRETVLGIHAKATALANALGGRS